jgi:serine phosphatase RsbU (regulator of sigma subunit)/predicted ester cyclase
VSAEEENKAICNRHAEALNRGDPDALDELMAPDLAQEAKREIAYLRRAFPDIHVTNEIQIAEGDLVANRFVGQGAHQGEYMGLAPDGEQYTFSGLSLAKVADGRIVRYWVANIELEDTFQQRLAQKALERERTEQELLVARRIQQASLPNEVPTLESWQISPYYQPAREVGGDFYDFFELEGGKVGLAVGDATGKGMPAALAVTASSSMLRAVAQDSSYSPGEVLGRVNETLLARIPPNMFVTCFYAILDPSSGSLSYANAGHNLPCCRRDDEHAAPTDLSARGMPLGLMPGMSYEEKETVLAPGEGVLFYTDGLIEAHNPQGEMFGTPRLRGLLSEYPEDGRLLSATLMEELRRFTGEGWEQEDDITLLALRRSAARS